MNLSEGELAVETSVVIPVRNRECTREGETKWSWRGLNPRPNRDILCFLHAYSGLDFRALARPGPPTTALFSESFIKG